MFEAYRRLKYRFSKSGIEMADIPKLDTPEEWSVENACQIHNLACQLAQSFAHGLARTNFDYSVGLV